MREFLGRTLRDVAQVLECAKGSEERIVRVLELLRRIVPYDTCALFATRQGHEPRLVVAPGTPPEMLAALWETLDGLHRRLVDERAHPPEGPVTRRGVHLAMPLVGNDEAIGVLFVSGASPDGGPGGYTEQHLRELSIVGAHLAGHLVMVEQARLLDEARREAEAANRMKDEFLALVSHELKTPLTSTLAWTHMLRSENADASGRARAVAAIEHNVHTQAKLIDEILDLACIVTADLRLDLEAVEPARLIRAAVAEQRLRAERRSIRLETVLDESVQTLVVDPARIVQVISTLVGKAIQLTPNGGHVGVHLERAGAHARIQVIDQSNGIASGASAPRGFESDGEDPSPVTHAYGKLGGGLAIVTTLVAAHGGRVRAESVGESGASALTIELPLPSEGPEPQARALAGITVLLVDDDDDMRIAVGAALEHQGAEVTGVASAAAALAALERSRPHVLLSDLSMPGESGYDLMRKVAARDATLPAASLTAMGRVEDRKRALAAGFRMHLEKPLEMQTLVAAVATLAGRGQSIPHGSKVPTLAQ
jgi:signal transduction histidine kinase/ActR/RegA family two-component response regulator